MPLLHGAALAFLVTAALLLVVGWVFWMIKPPRF